MTILEMTDNYYTYNTPIKDTAQDLRTQGLIPYSNYISNESLYFNLFHILFCILFMGFLFTFCNKFT